MLNRPARPCRHRRVLEGEVVATLIAGVTATIQQEGDGRQTWNMEGSSVTESVATHPCLYKHMYWYWKGVEFIYPKALVVVDIFNLPINLKVWTLFFGILVQDIRPSVTCDFFFATVAKHWIGKRRKLYDVVDITLVRYRSYIFSTRTQNLFI